MNCSDCNWTTGHSSNCKYGKGRYQYEHENNSYRYPKSTVIGSGKSKEVTYSVVRKSKYNSTCVICQKKISIGETVALIMWESRKKWVHDKCKRVIGLD